MTLDVVIPTFDRSKLLQKTVRSLLRAHIPDGLQVALIVVDNNSNDGTAEVIRELQQESAIPLRYVYEATQGSSASRNAGIAAGDSDLIGFIDDDEEVEQQWFTTIARELADPSIDFIGGPCLMDREIAFPDWLPPGYHAAIGVIPPKPRGRYGPGHTGMLNGGNAVLRRKVFDQVGLFSAHLGRSARNLLSEEDADLFRRVQLAGFTGMYVPELVIFHHVHEHRLTRSYHRRWAFWRAVSQGVSDRHAREAVPYLLGVPRYRLGRAVRGAATLPLHQLAPRAPGQVFANELSLWDLVGFLYGKFFFQEQGHYITEKS